MGDYRIGALTPETWGDFEALVERTGGLFSGCWCVHFHHGVPDGRGEDEPNRDFKRRMVEAGVAHAALVYDGPDAVAWAEYGTPASCPTSTTASSTTPRRPPHPTTGSPAST